MLRSETSFIACAQTAQDTPKQIMVKFDDQNIKIVNKPVAKQGT